MISGRNLYIENGTYQQHNIYGSAAGQGMPPDRLFCDLDLLEINVFQPDSTF